MRILVDLRLTAKLPLLLGTLALVSLLAMGWLSYRAARTALLEVGVGRVQIAVEAKRGELETWFDGVLSDMEAAASSPQTERALSDLSSGWRALGAGARDAVRADFITGNPYPAGERDRFDRAATISEYTLAHTRHHAGFRAILGGRGYRDVMLVDASGRVIYSVAKNDDLGDSLLTGPAAATSLGQLVAEALRPTAAGVRMTDFGPYGQTQGGPAAFIVAPILSAGHTPVGALVFRLSVGQLDQIVNSRNSDELKLTSYLTGADRRPLLTTGGPAQAGAALPELAALFTAGRVTAHAPGRDGTQSVIVASRIALPDMSLALVIEQPEPELLAPVTALMKEMAISALCIAALVALVAFVTAEGVARPLARAAGAMGAIAAGDFAHPVEGTARRDEVGDIARALQTFRDGLVAATVLARDGAFKSQALAGSSAALMVMDQSFRITYVNPSFVALMRQHAADVALAMPGFDPGAVIGTTIGPFRDDSELFRALAADDARLPHRTEIPVGALRFTLDINDVRIEGQGRIGYVVEWREVTRERMNDAVLAAIGRNLVTVELDAQGRILAANARICALLGVTADEILHCPQDHVFRADTAEAPVAARLLAGEAVHGRFWVGVDGQEAGIVDGGFTPVHDRDGALIKVIFIGSDVSQAEAALRAAEQGRRAMEAAQARVVEALRVGLRRLSEGDLTARMTGDFSEEYQTLQTDFNLAVQGLSAVVLAVVANAAAIEADVTEIAEASEDLSRRSERQAATLEQTAASLDQLTASVRSAAAVAGEANAVVEAARASAEVSGTVVREAVGAMAGIETSSERIARIIGVIDDIAFQTNLLALNAGVEAARAGEAGRGFAVVANEVRALAQRSSDAAREIDGLISEAAAEVKRGVGLVGQTGRTLEGIVASVGQIAQRMGDIALSAREQSAGLAEINLAVNQIDQTTQQNNALFADTVAVGQRLTQSAIGLSETVERFRVAPSGPDPALAAQAAGPGAGPVAGRAGDWATAADTAGIPVPDSRAARR